MIRALTVQRRGESVVEPRDPGPGAPGVGGRDPAAGDRVEALLTRAVQEQVAEQRTVASLLAEMRERLGRLDAAADDLRGLPEVAEELSDGLAGVRTDLRLLPEHVGGAVGGRMAEPLEGVRGSVRDLGAEVVALGDELAPLRPALVAVEELLAGVAARLAVLGQLQDAVQELREAVDPMPERLGRLDARMADVSDTVRRGQPPDADPTLRPLGELAASVGRVDGGIAALSDSLQGVTLDISLLAGRLAEVDERVASAGTPAPPTGAEIGARVEAATAPLAAEVAALRADLDSLRRLVLEDPPLDDADPAESMGAVVAGLADVVHLAVRDEVEQQLRAAVDSASAASATALATAENRLRAHVDEAVLALAEVVIGRRAAAPRR